MIDSSGLTFFNEVIFPDCAKCGKLRYGNGSRQVFVSCYVMRCVPCAEIWLLIAHLYLNFYICSFCTFISRYFQIDVTPLHVVFFECCGILILING